MHSEAFVETHLFSYVAKSHDILRLNDEIAPNSLSDWKSTEWGKGFGGNAQKTTPPDRRGRRNYLLRHGMTAVTLCEANTLTRAFPQEVQLGPACFTAADRTNI